MVKPHKLGKNVRMSFAKIDEALEMPNLIEVQKKSYNWFLKEGLMEVLRDVSPITDYSGNLSIEFVDFSIDSYAEISGGRVQGTRRQLFRAASCKNASLQ